ncbi:MAG: FKBP-type peptidyl-prolyl cis-trans isomerase FklB [Acidobacteriota bacterium]|jgi:FKBP-type peptidyl-prolyl cis-trans isomerase FklB|nr:FKBP-type peptidyl-prolyl cis-trans isomerase FklB [Acidobacteriota bacterium]
MKQLSALFATALLAALPALAQDKPKTDPARPQAQAPAEAQPAPAPVEGGQAAKPAALQDRASYIIGLNLGQSLKSQEVPVSVDLIVKGLRDGIGGANALLTPEEIQATMQEFQQQLMTQQQSKRQAAGDKNMKESQAYLEQNKVKAGVKTTASGLQYEVVKEGSGESPKPTDKVTVHYRGTLPDGKVFDSSYDRNEPATFPVNGVIPGWVEALQLMKPGAKYRLVIPPALAYAERGAGNDIGPNQVLIFDVELLSIDKTPAPAPGQPATPETEPEPPAEGEKPPTQ